MAIFSTCAAGCSFEVKIEADINDTTEHPQDGKRRPYLCTVCGKWFTTKYVLIRHKQLHTGSLPFSCTQCEKHFASEYYLSCHMNVHSSKYKYTECGKCFENRQKLAVHS